MAAAEQGQDRESGPAPVRSKEVGQLAGGDEDEREDRQDIAHVVIEAGLRADQDQHHGGRQQRASSSCHRAELRWPTTVKINPQRTSTSVPTGSLTARA